MGEELQEGRVATFVGGSLCATCIHGYKFVGSCSQEARLRCIIETRLHKKPYELRRRKRDVSKKENEEFSEDCKHV